MGIRVLVVDDHAVLRQALAIALETEDDIEVVDLAADAPQALSSIREHDIDVAIVDYVLDGLDGVTLTRELRARDPSIAVIMLTAEDDDRVLVAAMEAGCAGFLTKLQPIDEVVEAIRTAAAGEPVVNTRQLVRLLPQLERRTQTGSSENELTQREREVLLLMAGGATNPVIARELYLSLHTVRNHVQSVLRKLGAHSKLEAVAVAVRNGVIPATRTG